VKKENVLLYAAGVAILYGSYRLLKAVVTNVLDVMQYEANRPCQYGKGPYKNYFGSMPRARFVQGGAPGLGKRA
jgi:hypothetical protein